jgi:hypothetical protein
VVIQIVVAGLMWRFVINRYICLMSRSRSTTDNSALALTDILRPRPNDPNPCGNSSKETIYRLEESTLHAGATVPVCMRVVMCVCGLFWGLLILDMVGDLYGPVEGICVFMACVIGCPLLYCFLELAVDISCLRSLSAASSTFSERFSSEVGVQDSNASTTHEVAGGRMDNQSFEISDPVLRRDLSALHTIAEDSEI